MAQFLKGLFLKNTVLGHAIQFISQLYGVKFWFNSEELCRVLDGHGGNIFEGDTLLKENLGKHPEHVGCFWTEWLAGICGDYRPVCANCFYCTLHLV